MSRKFLALITCHKDEPFLRQFCSYYITQGIDDIYIIDDNSKDKKTLKELDFYFKNIHITYDDDIIKKNSIKKVYQAIKESFTWIINVDVDEYIATKKNITRSKTTVTIKRMDGRSNEQMHACLRACMTAHMHA